MKTRDVVIVGAGIIGLCIAWQLARRSNLRISVLEKGAGVGEGSTGASSAICRCRYSRDDMVSFARDGIDIYRQWQVFIGLTAPAAEFHNTGVLWMPGEDVHWADREHERMQEVGIPTEVLDDDELAARFPALNPCILAPDVETGEEHECVGGGRHFFEPQGGYVDPVLAAQDLVEACRTAGVEVLFRHKVEGIELSAGKVASVFCADGSSISTPLVVNAAGPWCEDIYRAVGLETGWDLAPVRIQVLYRDRPEQLTGHIPITADLAAGIYFRTQNRGQQLILGSILVEDERESVENPDEFQTETDEDFELKKLHCLHHRLPELPYVGKVRGYCGLYTVNKNDVHPVLGNTAVDGFMVANGFSGHGFKLAPAVGSMLAQAITGVRADFDTDVPMERFSVGRKPFEMSNLSVIA